MNTVYKDGTLKVMEGRTQYMNVDSKQAKVVRYLVPATDDNWASGITQSFAKPEEAIPSR